MASKFLIFNEWKQPPRMAGLLSVVQSSSRRDSERVATSAHSPVLCIINNLYFSFFIITKRETF